MKSVDEIARSVLELRRRSNSRDTRMAAIREVRAGNLSYLAPDAFPEELAHPIVANIIDTAARDLAEVFAPMPTISANSTKMSSDSAKRFAAKRTKIANAYVQGSKLAVQMYSGADQYVTYGFMPIIVEPDFDQGMPVIRIDEPIGAYWTKDVRGRVTSYVKIWSEPAAQLAERWPQYRAQILGESAFRVWGAGTAEATPVEVVTYVDDDQMLLYIPDRHNLPLSAGPNPLGRCPVRVAVRPGLDQEVRGQFDDAKWIQLARARMANWTMEAVEETVKAPLAVPSDVQRVPFGSKALLRTSQPDKIGKVGTEFPQAGFAQQQLLEQDIRLGSRYPEGRTGQIDASVITGRGVQALMGGFDTQVKTAQLVFSEEIAGVVEICFAMDEKFWPNTRKRIRGTTNGTPFEEDYVPVKDIKGSHAVDVTYGFAAGMDPNRALVFLLQARGDKLVSRDFVQRQLPMEMDVAQLQQQIDVEEAQDALKQGVFSMLASMGIMAQQGMDPMVILHQAAAVIKARQDGVSLHEAILRAFEPKPAPQALPSPELPAGPAGMEAGLPGLDQSGLPPGVAPGQAQLGPGGRPDVATLLAGLTQGGQPAMTANVSRRIPA